jgi:PAS domain S-box-containing protein
MSWLVQAIIASLAGAALLALVYWYLHAEYHERPLALWAWGWTLQALRYALEAIDVFSAGVSHLLPLSQLALLASAMLILRGTQEFVQRPGSQGWNAAALAGAIWILAAPLAQWPVFIVALPAFLLFGAISAWTGIVILKATTIDGLGRHLTGWNFILYGLQIASYPILSRLEWLAPWEHLTTAASGLLAALGVVMIYFRKVRTDLAQSENRYRLLFNRATDAIFLFHITPEDQPGPFVEVNDVACRRLGYSRDEMLALTPSQLIPPEHLEIAGELWEVMREQEHVLFENVHLTKNGSRIPVEVSAHLFDLNGTPTVMSIARDITERKKNEQSLRDSEEHYRRLFKDNPLPMWVYDRQTLAFLAVNTAAVAAYGYSRDEFLGMTIRDIRPPETIPELLNNVEDPPGKLRKVGVWQHRWKDGTLREVEITTHDLTFDGRPSRLVLADDVTERNKTAESDRRSRSLSAALSASTLSYLQSGNLNEMAQILIDRCRTITGAKFGIIFDLDTEGNARFLAVAGINRRSAPQKALYDWMMSQRRQEGFFCLPRGANLAFAPILQGKTILSNDPQRHSFWRGNIPAGHPVIESFLGTPLKVGRKVVGMIGLINRPEGFTEREQREVESFAHTAALAIQSARTELARNQAEEYLRQAQKMEAVGQLAGGIAHDFNNLLTVINGYGTILLRTLQPGGPHYREIEHIIEAGERAAALTRQLLAFSRRQVLELRVLDINSLIRNFEKILRRLIREDIRITLSLAEDLAMVKADPGQVEQILMNLIVNARDALPEGGEISVETSNIELDRHFVTTHNGAVAGAYVRLAISDTGVGMTEEVRQKIFDPFFTTKEQGRGTGLGLATVYGIVKQSGGYILVTSDRGKGSGFEVFLPRTDELPAPVCAAPMPRFRPSTKTVLVVEDDRQVLDLTATVLRSHGFHVIEAQHAEEAQLLFKRHAGKIDLLLSDVIMPEMNGLQLAEELRRTQPDLKVLFMSGYAQLEGKESLLHEINTAFIQKPFSAQALLNKAQQVLLHRSVSKSKGDP